MHSQPRELVLVLASGSPQRRRLLEQAGYRFEVVPPSLGAECGVCSRETPVEMVARLAYQKAVDVRDQLRRQPVAADFLVACDTLAECRGHLLGKPSSAKSAREMLQLLSGREHSVYSGLCVWPLTGERPEVQVARTALRMDQLGPEQIEEYVASGQWEGKAGGFGYQDRLDWLNIVEGSESNVIGLPLELLGEMLARAQRQAGNSWHPPSSGMI